MSVEALTWATLIVSAAVPVVSGVVAVAVVMARVNMLAEWAKKKDQELSEFWATRWPKVEGAIGRIDRIEQELQEHDERIRTLEIGKIH